MTCTEQSFLKDVANHQMTVIRDDGVNRHTRFKRPDKSAIWTPIGKKRPDALARIHEGASMTDKELLELAAKAVGIVGQQLGGDPSVIIAQTDGKFYFWNPLTDDGDAFCLAVKLRLRVGYYDNAPPEIGVPRERAILLYDLDGVRKIVAEAIDFGVDENAATRRAIVKAAAAIGKTL